MKQFLGSLSALLCVKPTDRPSVVPRIYNPRAPTGAPTSSYRPRLIDERSWWRRSLLQQPLRNGDTLTMMHTDTTYSSLPGQHAIFELHGVTATGQSVFVNVHNFLPYFYVHLPPELKAESLVFALETKLGERLKNNSYYGKRSCYIERWEIVDGVDVMYYKGGADESKQRFLKLYMNHPKQVSDARTIVEQGRIGYKLLTYEANIRYDIRAMVDTKIHGGQWIEIHDIQLPRVAYDDGDGTMDPLSMRRSRAQIEVHVEASDLHPLTTRTEIAPIRILSFDIECVPHDGERRFPDASMDPVISIGCHCYEDGRHAKGAVFCLVPNREDTIGDLGSVDCYVFHDERDLLLNYHAFLLTYDPDLITGYNINGFDHPYLDKRANALNIFEGQYDDMSRILRRRCKSVETTFTSRAHGTKKSSLLSMPGRITFDLFNFFQRTEKLRNYGLNAVASKFLGDQKEDVPYYMIDRLYRGTASDRARVNRYCYKDARLPVDMILRRRIIVNNMQMARVTGVPFRFLLERGEQIKTQNKLLRAAQLRGFLLPTKGPARQDFTGAVVIEPEAGFYEVPINTLDFASLYPSIMEAYNLCYTTYCSKAKTVALGLTPDDYNEPPLDWSKLPERFVFVKPHIRKGLLPEILAQLLAQRKSAKREMYAAEAAGDTETEALMNGKQLALKITANSVYGFTSAHMLCLTAISRTVTAYGRDMLYFTRDRIQARFNTRTPDLRACMRAGIDPNWHKAPRIHYEADSRVIYGDTDSVMVHSGNINIERAQELGREMSAYMKPQYEKPNDLEWEKTYFPYLLISKKRYCAMLWTKPVKPDYMDSKGTENKRRDSTLLVSNVINRILHLLLVERDISGAVTVIQDTCAALLSSTVDMSQLILSKGYGKTIEQYESGGKTAPVHIQVVKKAMQRELASAPRVGDRVPYVMVEGLKRERTSRGWGKVKSSEHAEDPFYAIENDVPIDGMWYITNQLMRPCIRLMQPVLCKDAMELRDSDKYYKKNPHLTAAYKTLFIGKHMNTRILKIRQEDKKSGLITGFLTRTAQCLVCHAPVTSLSHPSGATCSNADCIAQGKTTVMQRYRVDFEKATQTNDACRQTCIDCQDGMRYEDIICENKACPNWYQRHKANKTLRDISAKLERFDISDW